MTVDYGFYWIRWESRVHYPKNIFLNRLTDKLVSPTNVNGERENVVEVYGRVNELSSVPNGTSASKLSNQCTPDLVLMWELNLFDRFEWELVHCLLH